MYYFWYSELSSPDDFGVGVKMFNDALHINIV